MIRAFVHRNGQIDDFADDRLRDDAPQHRSASGAVDPDSPGRVAQPALPKPAGKPRRCPNRGRRDLLRLRRMTPPTVSIRPAGIHAPALNGPAGRKIQSEPPVRAEELLRKQLKAPRAKSLAPVLATLQPDQYKLVTAPAMQSMIVEGQPGTGKTIVASHRAAYLINEETPPENTLDGNILLIGPTIGYTNHVRDVVNRLTGGTDRIKILAIPQLMQRILGLKYEPRGPSSRSWQDVDWKLGTLARSAIHRLKTSKGMIPTTAQAYEHLRQNGGPGRPITRTPSGALT